MKIRKVNGEIDEIVGSAEYFHMEFMDDDHWWICVTSGGVDHHIDITTPSEPITIAHFEYAVPDSDEKL